MFRPILTLSMVLFLGTGCHLAPKGSGEKDGGTSSDVVMTTAGPVRGIAEGQTWAFKGIPYAAPPVGERRWKEPAPPSPWTDVRDASSFGAECVQAKAGVVSGSEDCLFVSVWTPVASPPSGGLRPVLFFIHGGGFSQGSSSQEVYEGRDLAEHSGAVVVTVQYRLGVFGFLSLPELSAESATGTSGNLGLLDQQAALRWVRDNITAFGGDPAQVTLFGESAGGGSVGAQLLIPGSAGLFERAIIESGTITQHLPTLAAAEAGGVSIATGLGCSGAARLSCLRSLSAEALKTGTNASDFRVQGLVKDIGYTFLPVVDGEVLPGEPLELFRTGAFHHVPLIIGNTTTEASYFVSTGALPHVLTQAAYQAELESLFGTTLATQVLAQYPVTGSTPFDAFMQAYSDAAFVCPARRLVRAVLQGQTEPVRRYAFSQSLRGTAASFGAYHTLELFFLFRTLASPPYDYATNPQEDALATTMQGYWARFAFSGDPNGAGAPAWPASSAAADTYLELGPDVAAHVGVDAAGCDFWDSHPL